MKTLSIVLCTTALSTVLSVAQAKTPEFEAGDNTVSTQICMAIATGSKGKLRNAVRAIRPSYSIKSNFRFVADKVECNGENTIDFAITAGNYRNAQELAKHVSEDREAREQDIAKLLK